MVKRPTKKKRTPSREEQLETALANLVDACDNISLLTGKVSVEKVVDVRSAMRLLAAHDVALKLLGRDRG